ncbi:MAG TPA: glycosyltransferase family 4 protein [Verrucomicrobiae bacterium]
MRFLMLNWRDPQNPLAGGAERVTLAYLKGLVARGHEVYWFAYDFPDAPREEIFEGIKIVRGGGKGTAILAARKWYRAQKKFDLVIDQHHGIPWYAPWWSQANCVAYIHEVLGPIWNSFYSWPVSRIGQTQERWTHGWYRQVPFWTPSDSTKKTLLAHGVHEVNVFPNGVDTQPLEILTRKPIESPLRLITVSRLAPNKRVDHAVHAVKILLQKNVATHLTVVGGGESETSLRQLAARAGIESHIEFTGKLTEPEKNRRLQQAHFLLHTSVREGWGLNVIEANAMGTPAVVYPVGGLVDSTVHGETGIITARETPETVAEALVEIIHSPENYERLQAGAWNRSKTFAWSQVLSPVCDWLEQQAARKSK